jgi:hypothetical protein
VVQMGLPALVSALLCTSTMCVSSMVFSKQQRALQGYTRVSTDEDEMLQQQSNTISASL